MSNQQIQWKLIYQVGAVAGIGAVVVGVLEILITFLPDGNIPLPTARDWLLLFQDNPLMGLRDLGLMNIIINALGILIFFALYAAHRDTPYKPHFALVTLIALLGQATFFATNRAFPMLALSQQYAAATSDTQRAMLEAAGQALISVGESHTPGTFLGFFLIELAGILSAIVMLRSQVFSKATAYAGLIGFGMLLVFEFLSSFVTGLSTLAMTIVMIGGIASMVWYLLIARRLFQLAQR